MVSAFANATRTIQQALVIIAANAPNSPGFGKPREKRCLRFHIEEGAGLTICDQRDIARCALSTRTISSTPDTSGKMMQSQPFKQ
eukprot:g52832.t1